jgi:hypothetical protein
MAHDQCPHLDYREANGEAEFEIERAYCTAVGLFVQPMRADICNTRHGLDFETDCEYYREAER